MPFLYHVTYLHRLGSIAAIGLQADQARTFGQAYGFHTGGRTFMTGPAGVGFWASRYEDHAPDDPQEGWVPVVLRVDVEELPLEVDEIGSRDARAPSFFTTARVEPDRLEVWDGVWIPVDESDPDQMIEDAMDAAEVEEVEGEHDAWGEPLVIYWMDHDLFIPPLRAEP